MKRLFLLFIFILIFLTSCSSSFHGAPKEGGFEGDSIMGGETAQGEKQPAIIPGQMTAAHWNDQKNYDFWLSLFKGDGQTDGQFQQFFTRGYFDTLNLVEVLVKNGEDVVRGAQVLMLSGETVVYQGVTNALGITYLYPKTDVLEGITTLRVISSTTQNDFPFIYQLEEDKSFVQVTLETDQQNALNDEIEIMFVIDTTGSMGDEIRYLKVEIDDVINQVVQSNPNVQIKLALLFYRDIGDDYVTRYFDFSTDILKQKNNLSKQGAAGGGDFEEAVDIALDEAVNKNWSTTSKTKLIIHVLDAPPHYNDQIIMSRYYNSIIKASEKGIRIIPVASSGIHKYTEYLLRCEAMMTGGDYVYITGDSGIGGEHIEATVGNKVVEYLNLLLIRLINEHYTGIASEPVPYYGQQN